MTNTYKKLVADTVSEAKAELRSCDKEYQAGVVTAFNKASGLIGALEELRQMPGSTFGFSVAGQPNVDHSEVEIRTNITDSCRLYGPDQIALTVAQDGTMRFYSHANGELCGTATNKADVAKVVKRVVKEAVNKGLI